MFDYNTQILIFSFLDVQDISNVLMTSKLAYLSRDMIVRDIWSERYPELYGYGLMEHNIFNMFYVDMVFEYLNTYNLDNIMKRLSLDNIPLDYDTYKEQYNGLGGYELVKDKMSKFSIVIGRLQTTYDKLHDILSNKLRVYESDDVEYDDGIDGEDYEMFVSALMEYGHVVYRDIMLSDNPYVDGTIDDDMVDVRSNPIWFEEQDYTNNDSNKHKVEDIDMVTIQDEIFYHDPDRELITELEDIEFTCDNMDDFESECMNYGIIPDVVYEKQSYEIDRMEEILDSDPINAIKKILIFTREHPDLLYNIKDGILNYMDELLPSQIEEINDMIE